MILKSLITTTLLLVSTSLQALELVNREHFTMNLDGRVLADFARYANNPSEPSRRLDDGRMIRSIRLGLGGEVFSVLRYHGELDLTDSQVEVKNAQLFLNPTENIQIDMGRFKPYFSLEEVTSFLHITFLERAMINTFAPKRHIGVGIHRTKKINSNMDYILSLGIFGKSVEDSKIQNGNRGNNISSRPVFIYTMAENCHALLGLNLSYTKSDSGDLQYDPRPESSVSDVRLVDTGTIDRSKDATLFGIESAAHFGQLSFQGEYAYNRVRRHDNVSLGLNGFYFYTSYFLTPDYRPFNLMMAKFQKVRPACKWGAVEVAARFSYIDLDSKDIHGGHERNVTFGVNWYLNNYFRFMMNVIKANANKEGIKTAPMIYTLRAQFDFG